MHGTVNPSARACRAVLERATDLGPATKALFLRLPPGRGLDFRPGQFVSVAVPAAEKPLARAYSIASPPGEPELLELCVDLVPGGPGSTWLFGLGPGAAVELTGPWGSMLLPDPTPPACVFVAHGSAIAPLRPMIHAALENPGARRLEVLHAATAAAGFPYRDDLEPLAGGDPRLGYDALVEDAADTDHAALGAEVERRWVSGDPDRDRHFFLCGVGPIVTRLRDLLRGAGYERRAVHYEKW